MFLVPYRVSAAALQSGRRHGRVARLNVARERFCHLTGRLLQPQLPQPDLAEGHVAWAKKIRLVLPRGSVHVRLPVVSLRLVGLRRDEG